MTSARIRLTLAYQGTNFHGWQLQDEARTVQGCLEEAAARLAGRPVRAHGSGRTDAGVHALGQVVHFDVDAGRASLPWQRALNAMLPQDMAVVAWEVAPPSFHARFSATAKTYSYTLWLEPDFILPQRRPFVWPVGRINLEALDGLSRLFLGRHDFAAFQNAGTPVKDTVREILSITRAPGPTPWETVIRIRATGFLKQMARNIVGCLMAGARGKLASGDILSLLAAGDRTLAPATAPARGLCLETVEYGDAPGN